MTLNTLSAGVSVGAVCSRQRFRHTSCHACVEACPAQALGISEGKIDVNAEKCIQCASCLFVCPEDAISGVQPPIRYYRDNVLIAPFSVTAPTVEELLLWHKEWGISAIAIDPASSAPWASVVTQLNIQLSNYGEPGWKFALPEQSDINVSRRKLFHGQRRGAQSGRVIPGKYRMQQLWPHLSERRPVLDARKCQLCGACWRVCKPQVLSIEGERLRISDAACTGCGNCLAVCLHQAIHLEMSIQPAMTIDLIADKRTCKTCHKSFLTFSAGEMQCIFCQHHAHGMRMA
ncbi:TPA: 4Fe-4S dicluster domain-containing protein [Citrobacter freundii]|uniref:4Fe-4S dicluster domain-containing protein n=1 Tax=Citrobacter freundii TaxID=546 RepID=UPI00397CADB0|nr:4Fe-4S dicluster domain-containing protein [Citrobacter freundii]